MPSIQVPINNTLPWTQAVATAGQTVFSTNWTADVASDVVVYSRADGVEPNDATQIVSSMDYNVAFIGSNEYVEVTFNTPRVVDDVVTIMRNTPADRLNLYINTNFTPSMLNGDFGRQVMMIQQRLLCDQTLSVKYNNSATLNPNQIADNILPYLPPNHVWRKNDQNEAIDTALLPANPVGSVGGNFGNDKRLVRTNIDNGNDIEEVQIECTDANVLQSTAGDWGLNSAQDLNLGAFRYLNFKGQRWPESIGPNGSVLGVVAGILGYLTIPTVPTVTIPNRLVKFINTTGAIDDSEFEESGTDLLLPADPTVPLAAATKQYVDGMAGGVVNEVVGTPGQIDVDDTDPTAPILSLDAGVLNLLAILASLDNGELVIGSTGNLPVAAALTAGTGITITPGPGSIEISTTGSGSGVTLDVTQANAFTGGEWVYLNGGTYTAASNAAANTAEVVGVVAFSPAPTGTTFTLQTNGSFTGSSGLTAGTVYFLGTGGALTATPPTADNTVVKPLLVANSTTSGIIINFRGEVNEPASFPYDLAFIAGFSTLGANANVTVQTYGQLVMGRTGTFTGDVGKCNTAPTGSAMILDIEKNGTSIYTVKPQFAAAATTMTNGTIKTDGTEDFVPGDVVTFKITQIGSSTAGQGVKFTLTGVI